MAIEFAASTVWAYVMAGVIALFLIGLMVPLPPGLRVETVAPRWHGLVLAMVCLVQFAVSMRIDRRYERRLGRKFYWMIWYPIAFWLIAMATTVAAVPVTIARGRRRARWRSPDRGIHQQEASP